VRDVSVWGNITACSRTTGKPENKARNRTITAGREDTTDGDGWPAFS